MQVSSKLECENTVNLHFPCFPILGSYITIDGKGVELNMKAWEATKFLPSLMSYKSELGTHKLH